MAKAGTVDGDNTDAIAVADNIVTAHQTQVHLMTKMLGG